MTSTSWDTLRELSYVPYSKKPSACIVKSQSGILYPGVRVENLSFPLTIDAIQSALFFCLSQGNKPKTLFLPIPKGKPSSRSDMAWVDDFGMDVIMSDLENIEGTFFSCNQTKKEPDFQSLKTLSGKSLAKESHFPVAAILKTDIGFIEGVNIEFDNWQKGLCAERVALAISFSLGASKFYRAYLLAPQGDFVSPCGACRQVLSEHMPEADVVVYQNASETHTFFVRDLLPYHFRATHLTGTKNSSFK